jgi:phospholipid/cholesterol/gamma-HCH transport system substrate-binding protein
MQQETWHVAAVNTAERKSELLVGLFVLIGLALLGTLIVTFGRFHDRFRDSYELLLNVTDAAGIINGSEVRMGGAKIGKVKHTPQLTEDSRVRITLQIDEDVRIPLGSSFAVASASMIGDKMIVVTPPEKKYGGSITAGSVIEGAGPSGLDAIQNNAEVITRDAKSLMNDAANTLKKIDDSMADIRDAAGHLSKTLEKVNTSILRQENLDQINVVVTQFAQTSEKLNKASDEIQPTLVEARQAIQSIRGAAKSAEETMTKVNARVDDLKPAFDAIPQATKAIAQAAEKAGRTIDQVTEGRGLLGTLTNDNEVTADAKLFIRNLRERGILRYKDADAQHPEDDPRNRFRGLRR